MQELERMKKDKERKIIRKVKGIFLQGGMRKTKTIKQNKTKNEEESIREKYFHQEGMKDNKKTPKRSIQQKEKKSPYD